MKTLGKDHFLCMRQWVYLFARHLDIARWRCAFENGSPEEVVEALKVYQNPDGGFGHGLEPDNLNPHSSPVQTFMAWGILKEIGCSGKEQPMVRDMMRYLEGCEYVTEKGCYWSIPSNNEYPCQLWYHFPHRPRFQDVWPPEAYCNASLVEFVLHYFDRESPFYQKVLRIIDYRLSFMPQLPVFLKAAEHSIEHAIEADDWQRLIRILEEYGIKSREECERLNAALLELLTASPFPWVREDVARKIRGGEYSEEELDAMIDRLCRGREWNPEGLRCSDPEKRINELETVGALWWPINDLIGDLRRLKAAGRLEM